MFADKCRSKAPLLPKIMSRLCLSIYFVLDVLERAARGFGKAFTRCRKRSELEEEEQEDTAHLWRISNVSKVKATTSVTNGKETIKPVKGCVLRDHHQVGERTSASLPIAQFSSRIEDGNRTSDPDVGQTPTIIDESEEDASSDMHEDVKRALNVPRRKFDSALGFLIFDAVYNENNKSMTIKLEKAIELPSKGGQKSFGTFVRVYLISPNGGSKILHKSKTSGSNVNPQFGDCFTVEMKKRKSRKYIRFSVFETGRQTLNEAIGHVLLPLRQVGSKCSQCYRLPLLHQTIPNGSDLGQVRLSLTFRPSEDKLTIGILRGRRLRLHDAPASTEQIEAAKLSSECEVYAKTTLMCCGERIKSMLTRSLPATSEPRFNEIFNFVVPLTFLDDTSIVIAVFLKGASMNKDMILGRVTLGPYICTQGERLTQWGKMLDEGRTVADWRDLSL